MFAMTKAARDRRRYTSNVRNLARLTFDLSEKEISEQDQHWKEWVIFDRREWRDLRGLLTCDIQDAFKARALAILFAPRLSWAPFGWNERDSSGNLLWLWFQEEEGRIKLSNLSLELQGFVSDLIELTIDTIRAVGNDEELTETLAGYNRLILQALAVLAEDDSRAVRLFERYQINDPVVFWNENEASGYNPLFNLLSADIPEKWKRLADKKVREVIRMEAEGTVKPRRKWEDALGNYASHIRSCFYQKTFPYSPELFAAQVRFVLALPNIEGRQLFRHWKVRETLAKLEEAKGHDLSLGFVRHRVLVGREKGGEAFSVYDADDLADAQMMLDEFGGKDIEIHARLTGEIVRARTRAKKEKDLAHIKQIQEDVLLMNMR